MLLSLLPFKRSKACASPTLGRSWQGPWLLSCGGELAPSHPGCILSNKAAYGFQMARKWLLSFPLLLGSFGGIEGMRGWRVAISQAG